MRRHDRRVRAAHATGHERGFHGGAHLRRRASGTGGGHAGRVRSRRRGRRQAQLVARGVVVMQAQVDDRIRERRIDHVDDPSTDVAAEQAALLDTGLDVGRGQRRDGTPANAGRQARQRADGTAGGVADLLGRRRLAFPQRLIGLRVGQIQRERCAVVDRDGARAAASRTGRGSGCSLGMDTGSRRSFAGVGRRRRSAPGGCRGARRAGRVWPHALRVGERAAASAQYSSRGRSRMIQQGGREVLRVPDP